MQTFKRILFVAVGLIISSAAAAHAQRPSPSEAQRILQTNPALLEQLRQRIMTSGLTPDQVRARLRAEGYPETLLDAYLPGSSSGADSVLNEDVFAAVRQLGIADSTEVDFLRCGINPDSLAVSGGEGQAGARDSTRTRRTSDSDRRAAHAACIARLDSAARGLITKKADADSGFVIFGLDFFRNQTTLFDANLSGPVDPSYRIGPGDKLVLILTGDVEESYPLEVTREGFVVIPQVGQVWVNNITLGELENILYTKLGRVYSGVRRGPGATTRFYVTPSRLTSNQIFVVGDVLQPGSYRVSSAGTALTALYAARGPSDNGSLRQVEIRRGSQRVDALDVYDYLLKGNAEHDVRLQNGDRIFVPPHGPRVRVVGQVIRPATYEIRPGETLADVLRFAGGFTPMAARQRVQIERIVPPNERVTSGRDRTVTDIVSTDFASGFGPAVPVFAGDIIRVFPVATKVRNRAQVKGNVWTPGPVGISPGMKVSDALRLAGGVKSDTYLGQVQITRLQPDSTRIQMRAVLADTAGNVINDFPIHEDDEIRVFSISEFRPERFVAISGAVRRGGQFPYHEGMTVRDLVLLAGGLEQSAYLQEAEIARLPADRTKGSTATTFRVPLDSSYVFERGPDGKYLGPPGLPAPSGPTPDVQVLPYDNVLILRQPGWELQRRVAVAGEVKFPGTYSLRNKTERVSDIIQRAGGLTQDAYAAGVVFYRKQNGVGRIGIELPDVLKNSRDADNLPLIDGDSIFIPRYSAVVNVAGAVNSPVAVTYSRGKNLEYYIRSAGGASRKADTKRAYVTQPNGKVESRAGGIFRSDPEPRPGSQVFVPEKDPNETGFNFLANAGAIAQILATLVTVIIALRK